MSLPPDGEQADEGQPDEGARRPKHRRVTTEPPDGSDPTPASGPPRHRADENDRRLRDEKPPHY